MKKLTILLIMLLLSACATLESKLKEDIGEHISHVMKNNGAPTQKAEIPTGTVYTWIQRRHGKECWISLITDKNDIIQGYNHKGCK